MFNPLITARLFIGYSMSSELREVGTEWTGVCGRPIDSLHCYYSTNIKLFTQFFSHGMAYYRSERTKGSSGHSS